MSVIIGLDTSCYTTSCAAVSSEGDVIASCRKLLPVKEGERGLRQSDAVFIHVKQIPEVIEELGKAVHEQVAAVCASARPRDDETSYMPVFQVGEAHARALAAMLGCPCFFSTHQRGHLAAAKIDSGLKEGPFLFLHLSGGTTELLSMQNQELSLLGGTRDLHAGQLVDRIGVKLGLPFPSGPYLEEMAKDCEPRAAIPASFEIGDLYCHLSGAETKACQLLERGMPPSQVAAEIYDVLARTVARLALAGRRATGIRQVLMAGGVASSALFRKMVVHRIHKQEPEFHVCFGKPEYSGDNAVGIAMIGRDKYLGR